MVSDSTKWQIGHSQTENDGPRDHQGKALIKGCHERTRARGCVPSQEKVYTNKNLTRVTVKSRAGCRQSRQTCRSGQERIQGFYRGLQCWRPRGEWDQSSEVSSTRAGKDTGLMIIK